MYFDSHAHLDDAKYDTDRESVIEEMKTGGVSLCMNIGADMESSKRSIELAEKYPFIYAAVGVHPHDTDGMTEKDIDRLREMSKHPKVKAIGEIGLDYYYDNSLRENQKKWFIRQMELSQETGLPFIIHDRDAHGDCMEILKKFDIKKTGGIMHCFSGSPEMAKELIKLGMVIAVGGTLTFKNAVKAVETVKEIPIEHILIETDSPYLAPVPHRGKRNTPAYVGLVAEKIAEIKGITAEEVARITKENAMRVLKIK